MTMPVKSILLSRFLCVVLFTLAGVHAVRDPHCASYGPGETGEGLHFVTHSLYNSYPTCNGYHTEISCCTRGYTELVWEKFDNLNTQQWKPVHLSRQRFTQEDNQTLVMNLASKLYDETQYRCRASNSSGAEISHVIDLVIYECVSWDHPPEPILPVNYQEIKRLPGMNLTLVCEGLFGPDYQVHRQPANITWYRASLAADGSVIGRDTWLVADGEAVYEDGRILITKSSATHTMTSEMHVVNISAVDYGNYTCQLANSVGVVNRTVFLKEGDPNEKVIIEIPLVDTIAKAVAITIVLLVALTTTAVGIYYFFGVDLKLYYKDRYRRSDSTGKLYDVFVVHAEHSNADREFVLQHLHAVLESEHNYKLCLAERDFEVGAPEIHNYHYYMSNSHCTLFVMSDDLIHHEWCRFMLQYCLEEEYRNMVFLILNPVSPKIWKTENWDLRKVQKSLAVAKHKVVRPRVESSTTYSNTLFRKLALGMFSYDSLSRKQRLDRKFWKRLRLALPPKPSTRNTDSDGSTVTASSPPPSHSPAQSTPSHPSSDTTQSPSYIESSPRHSTTPSHTYPNSNHVYISPGHAYPSGVMPFYPYDSDISPARNHSEGNNCYINMSDNTSGDMLLIEGVS